jgi:HlyD family secretion protein
MTSPDPIFRKAALDRLSSPEQLDQLMQVTTPKSWMALAAFGALLLTALVWGIFGHIADQVHGRGILLRSDGVFLVAARGEGTVLELCVQRDQIVTNGQLLARIRQPEAEIKLRQARTNYEALKVSFEELQRDQQSDQAFEQTNYVTEKSMLERMLTSYRAQLRALTDRTNVESQLLTNGSMNVIEYLATERALYSAQRDLYGTEVQIQQVEMAHFQAQARRRQLITERSEQCKQAHQQMEDLSYVSVLNSEVRSPYPGQILELLVKRGDLISANTSIATLQSTTNELVVRLFLNASDGERVVSSLSRLRQRSSAAKGSLPTTMEALLAPAFVRKEEFGLMRGEVEDASGYPVTPQGMLRVLQNQILVNEFSQFGAPIEVMVRLTKAPDTVSGFAWTSGKGPSVTISSGTLCEGTITINRRAPISLVLPILSKTFGN